MGLIEFSRHAAVAGVDGVIIPDLPPEESDTLHAALHSQSIDLIFLLAPTRDDARMRLVAERTSGFLYLVSLTGVTGARERLPPDLETFVERARSVTDVPLAVGFGISTPDQAGQIARFADGVIVGSALVTAIGAADDAQVECANCWVPTWISVGLIVLFVVLLGLTFRQVQRAEKNL